MTTSLLLKTSSSGFFFMDQRELESPASSTLWRACCEAGCAPGLWLIWPLGRVSLKRFDKRLVSLSLLGFPQRSPRVSNYCKLGDMLVFDLQCRILNISFSPQYKTYRIPKGRPDTFYPFVFNDIMGLHPNQGILVDDVKLALRGCIKDGYKVYFCIF